MTRSEEIQVSPEYVSQAETNPLPARLAPGPDAARCRPRTRSSCRLSDVSQGPGWWQASDGKWYPPQDAAQAPAPGWWLASDGKWYPPRESDEPPAPRLVAGRRRQVVPARDRRDPSRRAAARPTTADRRHRAGDGRRDHGADPAEPDRRRARRSPRRAGRPGSAADGAAGPADRGRGGQPANRGPPRDAASQIRRRNEASRADAVTQAPARFLAASRAVRLLESEMGPAARRRPARQARGAAPAPTPAAPRRDREPGRRPTVEPDRRSAADRPPTRRPRTELRPPSPPDPAAGREPTG